MPKGSATKGLGRAIEKDRKKRVDQVPGPPATRTTGVAEKQGARSVLEQSSLDDFISTAELARQTFEAQRGREFEIVDGPQVVAQPQMSSTARSKAEQAAAASRVHVPIPRRPHWTEDTTADELSAAEGESFVAWRRSLAQLEEEQGLVMTPYERNLDFWRQLWRCVERSTLLVQILDARDPEFYRCHDLERYVRSCEGDKQTLLLVNKADFLSAELRRQWATYFTERGVDFIFFSALRELRRQSVRTDVEPHADKDEASSERQQPSTVEEAGGRSEEQDVGGLQPKAATPAQEAAASGPEGPHLDDDTDVADCLKLLEEFRSRLGLTASQQHTPSEMSGKAPIVGFVGYPNVGKSSVINALFGAKKVSMSRTPGKTKHLQTLELSEWGITLCDCPGLVFPSVVATKAHLITNGVVPLDEVRDFIPSICIVLQRLGVQKTLDRFGLAGTTVGGAARSGEVTADVAHEVLSAIASRRQHFLGHGVADESWAARRLMRDYVTGALPYCEPPALAAQSTTSTSRKELAVRTPPAEEIAAEVGGDADDDDFDDLGDFLEGRQQPRTKRAERQLNKRMVKGSRNATLVAT
mmetsp:Transcript_31420/g.73364  ORF Transcript_31420/g.73364 Transcript_31420/m.73364 type:complete len:585 (+) Transcript_31420:143-1897(+)